jgi:hypothetical protein
VVLFGQFAQLDHVRIVESRPARVFRNVA